jgi:hypothetical protein
MEGWWASWQEVYEVKLRMPQPTLLMSNGAFAPLPHTVLWFHMWIQEMPTEAAFTRRHVGKFS